MIAVLYMGGSGGDLVASLLNTASAKWQMPKISPMGRVVRSYTGWQSQGFDLNDAVEQLNRRADYQLPAMPMLMHRHFKPQDLDLIRTFDTVDIKVNNVDLDLVARICINKHNDDEWHPNGDQGWLENHNIFGAFYRTNREKYLQMAIDFWKSWYWHSRMNIDYVGTKHTINFRDLFDKNLISLLSQKFDIDPVPSRRLHQEWLDKNAHYIR